MSRARKVIGLAGLGAAYLCGTYLTFVWFQKPKVDYTIPKKTYDQLAGTYDRAIEREEWLFGIKRLRKELVSQSKGKTLEIAGGTGRNIDYYPPNTEVTITDLSHVMLNQAMRKKNEKNKESVHFSVEDAHKLRFPDDSFDTVVDTFGFCSFHNPEIVVKEMERVCKPDGTILLLEHGKSTTSQWLTNYLDRRAESHDHDWGCLWNKDIQKIIKESNLVVVKEKTQNFGTTYYYVLKPSKQQIKE